MIIFERNNSNIVMSNSIHFDCYKGSKLVGYFELYSDYSFLNDYKKPKRKEIYIEVLGKYLRKGYATDIYKSFIRKSIDLGFTNRVFYAYILNVNKASLALHESLGFKRLKQLKVYTLYEVKIL